MAWRTPSETRSSVNKKDTFTLSATGDAMVFRCLLPYQGVSNRFDELIDVLRTSDVAVSNLETVVHDYQSPPADVSGTIMRTPPEVIDDLLGMGIDMVSTANNHIFDYGAGGLQVAMDEMESRGMSYAGIGNNLFEARQPGYFESPAGRIGLVSTTTRIQRGGAAGQQTAALHGRPGVNPLRVEKFYNITGDDLTELKSISENIGIEDIKREARENFDRTWVVEGWGQEDLFHFDDMKFRTVESDEDVGITWDADDEDTEEVCGWIEEASKVCDWVVTSIHSHKGAGGHRHTETTPELLEDLSHRFIDSGADAVIGTGTKVLRGIEVYNEKPIFYSLGNFIDNRPSITRFPPWMYERWGLDDYTKPSQIYDARFLDEDGQPHGQLGIPEKWESVIPRCSYGPNGGLESCTLYPITLQRTAPQPQRGIPVIADGDHGREILERTASLSEVYGTEIEISDGEGRIQVGG